MWCWSKLRPIRQLVLSSAQTVLATLGFNLGIELAQLGIVAVVMPLLLMLRGGSAEPCVRRGACGVGGSLVVGVQSDAWRLAS